MLRYGREALEVVTVGLPFCAFKIITGLVLLDKPWLMPLGWLLIALGMADLAVNGVNLTVLTVGRPRALRVCTIQILFGLRGESLYDELGTSLDVFLAFVLVAAMIAFGQLGVLSRQALQIWNIAVVLNVLGAGVGRLYSSIESLKLTRLDG